MSEAKITSTNPIDVRDIATHHGRLHVSLEGQHFISRSHGVRRFACIYFGLLGEGNDD
jgi:hypothetical protein